MAKHLDLEEQEQLDQLKHFWKQYGNLITWALTIVLAGFAAWNGWNWWQRDQAAKAAAMFEELDRAGTSGDADKVGRIFADLKQRFPGTAFAQQAGLLAARIQFEKGQADAAKASLTWVAEQAAEDEYRTIARIRLAGVLLDAKQFDEALKQLDGARAPAFEALVADRKGDVLMAQGKADAARTAYETAFAALDSKLEYKRLVEAKLIAMGVSPAASAGAAAASAAASGASK